MSKYSEGTSLKSRLPSASEKMVVKESTISIINNPASTRIARLVSLHKHSARAKYGRFLAEGPQAVREAVHYAAQHVLDIYLTDLAENKYQEIVRDAQVAHIYVHRVSDVVMRTISADAQGIVAVVSSEALLAGVNATTPQHAPAKHIKTDKSQSNLPKIISTLQNILVAAKLIAVLTQTQDPGNAGTIIRAADAAGADAVVLARGSVDVTNPKVVRSSAGSIFHLPVITGIELEIILQELSKNGLRILAADGSAKNDLFTDCKGLAAPSAWLFGNEAHGLSQELLNRADATVSIPLYGAAESLNVASAAAICLYASAREQRVCSAEPKNKTTISR